MAGHLLNWQARSAQLDAPHPISQERSPYARQRVWRTSKRHPWFHHVLFVRCGVRNPLRYWMAYHNLLPLQCPAYVAWISVQVRDLWSILTLTSSPRAATSVATRILILPRLKSDITCLYIESKPVINNSIQFNSLTLSRNDCDLSPWRQSTL
jgi:hypothetical protein